MIRKITVAAVSVAAAVAFAACSRGDDTAYDTAAGATTGAMATPAPELARPGVGVTTTTTVGSTTVVLDSVGRTTSVTVGGTTQVKTTKRP